MKGAIEAQDAETGSSESAVLEREGHWRIERLLGRGGMGSVYLARDLVLQRAVAIKVMSPLHCGDQGLVERFEREARLMARLEHPNLVPVYSVGRTSRGPYIVMKLLEGMTLADAIKARGRLSLDEARCATRQLAAGLQYIHERQVVHRDVKPSNIYVGTDGHLTLLDLGVARDWSSDLTGTGAIIGTPRYMAPELLQGEAADHRSDLYALGTVVFEMLTGKPMVEAQSERSVIRAHSKGILVDQSQLGDAPPALTAVVLRALSKDPEARFESVAAFAQAFDAVCEAGASAPEASSGTRLGPLSVVAPALTRFDREPRDTPSRPSDGTPYDSPEDSETRALNVRAPASAKLQSAPRSRSVALWGVLSLLVLLSAGGVFYLASEPSGRRLDQPPRGASSPSEVPPSNIAAPEASAPADEPSPGDLPAQGVEAPLVEAPSEVEVPGAPKALAKPPKHTRRGKNRKPAATQGAVAAPGKAVDSDDETTAVVRCLAISNKAAVRAYVEVDGLRQGATPMTLRLEPGQHRLEFIRDGFKPQSRELTLASGDSLNLSIDLTSE